MGNIVVALVGWMMSGYLEWVDWRYTLGYGEVVRGTLGTGAVSGILGDGAGGGTL